MSLRSKAIRTAQSVTTELFSRNAVGSPLAVLVGQREARLGVELKAACIVSAATVWTGRVAAAANETTRE
jgi:hypothetical protein